MLLKPRYLQVQSAAFSGLLTDTAKWFTMRANTCSPITYGKGRMGPFGIISAVFGPAMFPYCSPIYSGQLNFGRQMPGPDPYV